MSYYLVTVSSPAHPAERDALAGELWGLGAVGIEELPDGLRAAFAARVQAELAASLPGASAVDEHPDTVGLDASRDLLQVERGGVFAVHPPWLSPPEGSIGIEIDPGHAFGSGSHATTRLALALLKKALVENKRVLDVGCGTGVLAIASALLGAKVVAVDIDPAAVLASTTNAARNGVTDAVEVRRGSADAADGEFDLAIINVTIDLHEIIAPLRPVWPATIVVAGLLHGPQLHGPQLTRAAAAYGRNVDHHIVDGDWVSAVLV